MTKALVRLVSITRLPVGSGQVQHGFAVLDAGVVDQDVHRHTLRVQLR